jgi:hypothetical protein
VFTQPFKVFNNFPGCIIPEIRVRCTSTGTTLIREYYMVRFRIEIPSIFRDNSHSWAAVKKECGGAALRTNFFVINRMDIRDFKGAGTEWFNLGKQ